MKRGNMIALMVVILGAFAVLIWFFFTGSEKARIEAVLRECADAALAGDPAPIAKNIHPEFVFSVNDRAGVDYEDVTERGKSMLRLADLTKFEIRTIETSIDGDRGTVHLKAVFESGEIPIKNPYPYNFQFTMIRVPDPADPKKTVWQILGGNLELKKPE